MPSDTSDRPPLDEILEATYRQAEQAVFQHASPDHPEIECQCLECLHVREIAAQLRAWKQVR